MATWEITITCQDGSRLRFSELRGRAPKKDEIIETADAGKMIKARIDAYREERQAGGGSRSPFFWSRRSKFRIWPPSFGSSIPPAIDYAFRGADPARIREDASGFKNSVIGPQIRSQPGQGPNTGRLNARSVDYLPSCQRHDHSRFRFSLNRFVVMRTVKEQAAAARVSGLQESICDRRVGTGVQYVAPTPKERA